MQVRLKHNLEGTELAKALSGVIVSEGIGDEVIQHLEKAEHGEPIPEKYIRSIVRKFDTDYHALMEALSRNIDLWFSHQTMTKSFLRKADNKPPLLTDGQIDELRGLIEAHFRRAVGLDFGVPDAIKRKWVSKMGIKVPDDRLDDWLVKCYVGGRLSHLLANSATYSDMKKLATRFPLTREDELMVMMAQNNAARWIKGYGQKLANMAEDVVLTQHKAAINQVVQNYFRGTLKATKRNLDGLQPNEVESLETSSVVKGWKQLSSELRNRFKQADAQRDWDRVAITEVRFATNLGRLSSIQAEGGGDPNDIKVYYHVQPTACKYCKKLYLNEDGTPKIFKLSTILQNVVDTGGTQIGLSASKIGESGGWVPNAICHPFGHCVPVRKIEGYAPIPTGDLRPKPIEEGMYSGKVD